MGNSLSFGKHDISSCIRLGRGRNNRFFKVERPDSTGTPLLNPVRTGTLPAAAVPPPVGAEAEPAAAVKRIKVVITKQQLQELLSKKISVEAVILGIDRSCNSVESRKSWKPILKSIPEENELC
ncbi:uncharacterized protein LOC111406972 [Olea europaea var. sylvestris]|uniref:uncharacterized protein LOC111406972 n=1 Tax=Olea europaea var. sylvestris TaxID=158386 RepID=UPI000C1D4F75|nr:uncharacterized protein LOC111406972 [Olea europaea var. sylvestris]